MVSDELGGFTTLAEGWGCVETMFGGDWKPSACHNWNMLENLNKQWDILWTALLLVIMVLRVC